MAAGTSSYCRGGLQPLKATVPFQLQQHQHHRRSGGDGGRAASVPCSAGPVEKASRSKPPRVWRTSSLDNVLGSYLLGQWPRDAEGAAIAHMSDKSTQTPVSWHETGVGRATAHKRSASWSSVDHRREIAKLKQQLQRTKLGAYHSKEKDQNSPVQGDHTVVSSVKASSSPASFPVLATVSISPCLHNSLDAINQELEEVFVKEPGDEELLRILDVPDGHRAPVPVGTRDSLLPPMEHSSSSCSSLSLSPSPSAVHGHSPHTPARAATEEHSPCVLEKPLLEQAKAKENSSTSPVLAFALSPRPNHTYVFKREPPEGCEKVRAFEEVVPPSPDQTFQPSCPDKNKVHFNPTGSAFCQFSLVKPLIPSVDFLFRDFSTSNPMLPGTFSSCQSSSSVPVLGLQKDSRGDNFTDNPPSLPLSLESWKRHQAEDTVLFHSSLVV